MCSEGDWFIQERILHWSSPKVYSLADYESLAGKLKPVYGLTKGLSNNAVVKAVNGAFDKTGNNFQDDYLDENVRDRFGLIDTSESVYSMHFPKDMEELNEARKKSYIR